MYVDSEPVRKFDAWAINAFYPLFRKDRARALTEAREQSQTMNPAERDHVITSSLNLAARQRYMSHPLRGLKLVIWGVSLLSTVLNLALEAGPYSLVLIGLVAAVTSVQYFVCRRQAKAYDQLAEVLAESVGPRPT
ncbi:hypothetical protein B7H18_03705 [Pseudomonas putida]|uniref:Uncharacterized protein n=2 Tax=Pseudomonas TaxID=286 RepID=A0A1X0ZMX9_PSEPU|nr:hypothetical protein B7H18_03705 [Pseudomonas putida]ORL58829.1 hypothetical protein B7H17_25220 [Pseudomonas putida]